jgi:hypothetical protein
MILFQMSVIFKDLEMDEKDRAILSTDSMARFLLYKGAYRTKRFN